MITYNEMYQAQQRYEDLMNEAKATQRYSEVLSGKPGAMSKLMHALKAALSKPATARKPAISKRLTAH